jgi:hypothetical protein
MGSEEDFGGGFVDIGGSDDNDARSIRTIILYELKKVVVGEVVVVQMAIQEQQRDEEEEEEETRRPRMEHPRPRTPCQRV